MSDIRSVTQTLIELSRCDDDAAHNLIAGLREPELDALVEELDRLHTIALYEFGRHR